MILLVNKNIYPLAYKTEKAACFDIYSDELIQIEPGAWAAVKTGLFIESQGDKLQALFIRSRSGLALHEGVAVLNAPGVIDEDYTGEIRVILINHHPEKTYICRPGDRIAQGSIENVYQSGQVAVEQTKRSGGFGSTND